MDQVEGKESKNKHVGASVLGPGQRPETHLRKWGPGREWSESSGQKEDSQGVDMEGERVWGLKCRLFLLHTGL